ncbi:hypothetical protein ACFWY6_27165 [Streptomyces sp. NPDC059037]|uniref:hypothetical protein n=1 Tax=Streptomyces sp. NPDC059037 TaxID=3346710 RepID=UPI00367AC52C
MHTAKMWGTHNDGPLPMAYPYGERPLAGEWGSGFGSRDAPQPQYRGVPVPANIRLNPESFQRGVDAALERYGIPADTPLEVTFDESAQPQFDVIRATEAETEADHTPQAREFRYEVCQRPFSAVAALSSRQRVHLDRAASVPVTRTNLDIAPEAPQKANEPSPEEKG